MTRSRGLVAGVLLAALLAGVSACGGPGEHGTRRSTTWDLAQPPTREDVGMEGERSVAVHETDEPAPVTFVLPGDRSLKVPMVHVAFNNLGAVPARGSDPTGFDAWTGRMTLADLVPEYRSVLEQLGMRTGRVRKFEFRAGSATNTKVVTSPTSSRRYGYLRLTVVAYFEAASQRGYLTVAGSWGAARE